MKTVHHLLVSALAVALFTLALTPAAQASVILGHSAATVLSSGLVGYWPLDGNTTNWRTGSTADLSGNGGSGALNGMATTTSPTIGVVGQALQFNGSTGYIATNYTIPAQNTTTSLSWSAWVKLNPSSAGLIMGFRTGASFIKLTPNSLDVAGTLISHSIPTGSWVHVTIVKSGSNFTYYQNGAAIATAASVASVISHQFFIGGDPGTPSDGFLSGGVDDVRVYNRALSAQEVQQLYAAGGGTHPSNLESGLVAYWPMEEGSGNTTRDLSPFKNTGALVNSPAWTTGKFGQALNFTGSQYVSTVNSTPLQLSVGTVSAWINGSNCVGGDGGFCGILVKQLAYSMFTLTNTFGLFDWGTGTFRSSGVNVNDGVWHLVTETFRSGVSNGTLLYVDGVLKLTTTMTVSSQAANLLIGYGGQTTQYYNGKIDDVRVYNRVLSAAEIKQFYINESANIAHSNTVALSNGLVGYWTLDGSSTNWRTNTTSDSSGQGATGKLVSMSTTTSPTIGKIGGALKFNGSTQYIQLGSFTTSQFTFAMWVFPTGSNTLGLIGSSDQTVADPEWRISTGNQLQLLQESIAVLATSAGSVTRGVWSHIAVTFSTNGTITFYINGVPAGSTVSSPNAWNATPPLLIGKAPATPTDWFTGSMDDVRIYKRALSAQEIQQLYLMGK